MKKITMIFLVIFSVALCCYAEDYNLSKRWQRVDSFRNSNQELFYDLESVVDGIMPNTKKVWTCIKDSEKNTFTFLLSEIYIERREVIVTDLFVRDKTGEIIEDKRNLYEKVNIGPESAYEKLLYILKGKWKKNK